MAHTRVDIAVFDPPRPAQQQQQPRGRAASTPVRATQYTAKFKYEISVGCAQGTFECTPAKVVQLYRALLKDREIGDQLRFIETQYFRRGFRACVLPAVSVRMRCSRC